MFIFDIIGTLLSFLPVWFALFVIYAVSLLVAIAFLRLIAFILDILPFA